MKSQELALTHVTERDIDLLLVEELTCPPAFRAWLLGKLPTEIATSSYLERATSVLVRHSVWRGGEGYGETDIEATFSSGTDGAASKLVLFIEDKIDAQFTTAQPQRYRAARECAVKEGRAEEVACVIFAPAAYLAHTDAACFNLTVSYEELAAYFAGQAGKASGELAARYLHRGEVIEQAIGKCRRGYEVVADPTNTSFWKGYYELASTVAPELQMDGPGEKPTYSIDIYFKQALPRVSGLRKAWLLKHSLENGVAMIEVSQWGTRFDALEPVLRPALEADMLLRQAGKSIQIRLPAPTLDTSKPLPSQATEASAGIEVLKRLRSWYLKHAEVVGKCQWIAEPVGV